MYVNGLPAIRVNMPNGTVLPTTRAVKLIKPSKVGKVTHVRSASQFLVPGPNTVAVEVHRAVGSLGAVFDMQVALVGDWHRPPITCLPPLHNRALRLASSPLYAVWDVGRVPGATTSDSHRIADPQSVPDTHACTDAVSHRITFHWRDTVSEAVDAASAALARPVPAGTRGHPAPVHFSHSALW